MKAFAYAAHGGASVGKVLELPVPVPGPEEVKIKVFAASFNPIDFKRRKGDLKMLFPEKKWPVILGYDAAGVVEEVGKGVTKFKPGDQVYVRIGHEHPELGTCAEYTLAHQRLVAPKPANASYEEAAAIPLAGVTALQMLRKANFKKGDVVFVSGGAGGVGHYAIQLAKAMGASKVVSSASSAKHALLKSLGADEVIDYKTQDYVQVYKDKPFDVALDNVSESIKLCQIVKPGGSVVSVTQGFDGQTFVDAGMTPLGCLLKFILGLANRGILSAAAKGKVEFSAVFLRPNSEDLEKLTSFVEAGQLKSVIEGNVFVGIDKGPEALAAVEGGRTTGKVVVKVV